MRSTRSIALAIALAATPVAAVTAPAAIEARGWGWRYATRQAWAVRDASFRIAPGERVLLLGASGAGKSTLLRALAGLDYDVAGSGTLRVPTKTAVVFQDSRLLPWARVLDNVVAWLGQGQRLAHIVAAEVGPITGISVSTVATGPSSEVSRTPVATQRRTVSSLTPSSAAAWAMTASGGAGSSSQRL